MSDLHVWSYKMFVIAVYTPFIWTFSFKISDIVLSPSMIVVEEVPNCRMVIRPKKKKTSLFPVAGLKIAMRNAFFFFFFFFFTIHEKSNAQCGFYFFKQNFRKKIHQNNSLGFFSTFIKNITSFISKWFMWPFILHALGASLMNFLPWPKLHHIWKKIQSKCTECM